MKKPYYLLIVSVAILSSCNNNKAESEIITLQSKVDSLQKVVVQLNTELDGYKFSPEKLCANMEQLYKENKENKLKEIYDKLKKYHPESSEIKTIESYLNAIKEKRAKEQERIRAERMKAVDVLQKKYDDVNGITWYYSKLINHKNWSNMSSLYIGKNSSKIWLRLKMSYYGSDWIFFERALLSYDGITESIPFDEYRDKKTENSGGMVWEWIDVMVESDLLSYLKKYVNGEKPKMRLSGKYTHDKVLTSNEIKAMKEILLAYDVLKTGK